MSRIRTDHYYMTPDELREYNRQKQQEYRNRIAELEGRSLRPYNKN